MARVDPVTGVRRHLLDRLADGGAHPGAAMAAELGVSRAAVAKQVARLRETGWAIETTADGYRLDPVYRPLDADIIRGRLNRVAGMLDGFELLELVDSTSNRLAHVPAATGGRVSVCVTEVQSAGRGRRGRAWHSRPGASITFSVGATLPLATAALGGLSLAAGIAIAEVLADHGVPGVQVKWPNDLQVGDAKLGGLLVEISGESGGPSRVVLGVGINHCLRAGVPDTARAASDIVRCAPHLGGCRSRITGDLVAACVELLTTYPDQGLAAWTRRWERFDALHGREVEIDAPGGSVAGVALGISEDGALRVRVPGGEQCFHSGDVSVRPS